MSCWFIIHSRSTLESSISLSSIIYSHLSQHVDWLVESFPVIIIKHVCLVSKQFKDLLADWLGGVDTKSCVISIIETFIDPRHWHIKLKYFWLILLLLILSTILPLARQHRRTELQRLSNWGVEQEFLTLRCSLKI